MCQLTNDMHDYVFQAQGKITIPGVDDGEECQLTDVSCPHPPATCLTSLPYNPQPQCMSLTSGRGVT